MYSYFFRNSSTAIRRASRGSGATPLACNSPMRFAIHRVLKPSSTSVAISGLGLDFDLLEQPRAERTNNREKKREKRLMGVFLTYILPCYECQRVEVSLGKTINGSFPTASCGRRRASSTAPCGARTLRTACIDRTLSRSVPSASSSLTIPV